MSDKGSLGEEFVNELAYNSFLKFWCYPGPKLENGDKKEISDLLIIFDDTLIVVSVKNYEFKGNYSRYFNRTINKALNQIHGACRILFSGNDVYIKHPDRNVELFPREQIKKIFRIVVNLGEGTKFYPFNGLTKNNDYVTFFDKSSFETVIDELDTIADFTEYLQKREQVFKNKNTTILSGADFDFIKNQTDSNFGIEFDQNKSSILISGTEKDLLAIYFREGHNFPNGLNKDEQQIFLIIDGAWEEFAATERKINKEKADKVSYFIDEIIRNALSKNELQNLSELRLTLAKSLLSFSRLKRRRIVLSYFEFQKKHNEYTGSDLPSMFTQIDGVGVLFVFITDQINSDRLYMLKEYAIISYYIETNFEIESLLLISTNSRHEIELIHKDKLEISAAAKEKDAIKLIQERKLHAKQNMTIISDEEFPT
ncbi:hypothetical protein [Flavobacterium sp.]|uniref:hypothetical protein n=1 Tax=Flavobacterium sp. TaxID=239 RepID=UPI0031E4912B